MHHVAEGQDISLIANYSNDIAWFPIAPPTPIKAITLRLTNASRAMIPQLAETFQTTLTWASVELICTALRQLLGNTSEFGTTGPRSGVEVQPEVEFCQDLQRYLRPEQKPWWMSLVPGEEVELLVATEQQPF